MDHNNKTIGINLGYGTNANQCARISFVDYGADYSGNRLAFNVEGTESTLCITGDNTIGVGYNTIFSGSLQNKIKSLITDSSNKFTSSQTFNGDITIAKLSDFFFESPNEELFII